MKAYSYTAYTDTGRRRTGTVVAETEAHAAQELAAKGLFVSELADRGTAGRKPGGGRARGGFLTRSTRLNADLQAVFTRQMAVLLGAELPMEAALEAVRAGGASPAMDAVAARARAALLEGQALSDALEHSGAGFARAYIAALRAGERSGDVGTVMAELADYLDTQGNDRAQIGAALVYPGFVAAVAVLVCGILMVNVAPEIVAMFELSDRPLPDITRVVLGISDWIRGNLLLIGAGIAGLVVLGITSGRVPVLRNARDRMVLRLPVAGRLMRLSSAVQYLRTLALVLGSRHAVLSAVDSAGEVLSVARFQREAQAVSEAVRQGESLSTALDRLSFIPPVARQLVSAGEMSAKLARMAERSAVLVENGLSLERKRIAALLEPMLMMLVGALVLTIVLAVLLPIFDLQSVVAG
ncbi:type II secretion system F family protein [Puniceibacterium sp. IMCC21224]|uniref:type II secretion system F family protein n=1 Tax=Puniceibacterium sp. IMCC21224 TaxID=1618204 RepID=UPI00065D3D30|nr:type II secretion system F family protein [Puniceibacterium sp. IMCC21224]KMK64015.1 type II secretory pathway, component PulF [Puniceibacterium sp. IMCC21224]